MRILIISSEFYPTIGGAGTVARQFAEALSSLGHRVTLITHDMSPPHAHTHSISRGRYELIRVKENRWLHFPVWLMMYNFGKFERIIINDLRAAFFAGICFPESLLQKCKYILHGAEPEVFLSLRKIGLARAGYMRLLRHASEIIAVSAYMKEKFIRLSGMNWLEHKIRVVYAGIDLETFTISETKNIRERFISDPDTFFLLSVSRITKRKGYETMVRCFSDCLERLGDVVWVIVGDGEYKSDLQKLTVEFGVAEHVRFAGAIDRQELLEFYSQADAFWLLSECREAFGLVYLESQACGTPTIGYARCGVKEAIEDGKTGFLLKGESLSDEFCKSLEEIRSGVLGTAEDIRREIRHFDVLKTAFDLVEGAS